MDIKVLAAEGIYTNYMPLILSIKCQHIVKKINGGTHSPVTKIRIYWEGYYCESRFIPFKRNIYWKGLQLLKMPGEEVSLLNQAAQCDPGFWWILSL